MPAEPFVSVVFGLDFYDRISNLVVERHKYDGAFSLYETMSGFEFDSRVFDGSALNPEQGSIISPERTVKFFPATNSIHVINTHQSSNVTSIKRIIRAVMPSNFITEPHWLLAYVRADSISADGALISYNYYVSTKVSYSVDVSYYQFLELLDRMKQNKYTEDSYLYFQELAVVIRREL